MTAPRDKILRLLVISVLLNVTATQAGYGHGHLDYKVLSFSGKYKLSQNLRDSPDMLDMDTRKYSFNSN